MTDDIQGLAVVTGGASGIGAACAQGLREAGARIVIVDRNLEAASRLARELDGFAFAADVADEPAMTSLAQAIERDIGPVEVLVNSAGVLQVPVRPTALDMRTWDEVVRVDQRGTWVASIAFARAMLARRHGVVVNIASISAMRSLPLHAYAPAKAAVVAMTECLAGEWGPSGVRVNAVSPGYVRTPALQAAIDKGERDLACLTANAALERTVEPSEVADAVVFLAGRRAAAITGVNLPVDAGWLVATPWHTYGGLRAPLAD